MNRKLTGKLLSAAGALLLVGLAADPAAAHVTVNPREVVGGGFAVLTFRMPNERDEARTKQLSVSFPADHPFTSVRVKRVPGWSYEFRMVPVDPPIQNGDELITEVVGTIVWRADSREFRVRPTEFIDFDVSVGRLPTSGQIAFPAIQVYDNGEVVRWVEPTVPGQPAPERPAPVLRLVPPPSAPSPSAAAGVAEVRLTAERGTADQPAPGAATPLVLISAAAVLFAAGMAGGVLTMRRRSATR
jgi:uncharacterized protein YcnI